MNRWKRHFEELVKLGQKKDNEERSPARTNKMTYT